MLKKIKALYDRNRRFSESYGGDATRNTYMGQLNFESGKIFFVIYITLIVWVPYIFNDINLHQFPAFAVAIRVMLTVTSVVLILLRMTKSFKNRPLILLMALMTYFYVATALVTATSGENAPSYIGGFTFIIMMPVFAPFPLRFKVVLSISSFFLFFIVGALAGIDFSDNAILYAVNDLLSSLFVSILLSSSQEKVRSEAWKQQQKLNSLIKQQEKNLATIFKLAKEAEIASKTKSDFLANMSHEIRTPMNAIIGISELIMQKNIPQDIYEDALAIKSAGNNLLAIINDILDITKIESGKLDIVPSRYSFASVFHDMCSIMRERVSEKKLMLLTYVDSSLPDALFGDEIRIRQILLNLLSNAVKYTESGHISISVEGEVKGEEVTLEISVSDSGIGIKEDDMDKLFNKFVQVDTHRNKGIEGTGLGLALSKQLCKLMGADIIVKSEYGKGSTFTFVFTQKIVDDSPLVFVVEPLKSRSLIYEVNPLSEMSAAKTFDNLNIPHTLVNTQSDFFNRINDGVYDYAFLPSFLYDGVIEKTLTEKRQSITTVLMAEFGDFVDSADVKVLSMPISCFSVSGILNGEDMRTYSESKEVLNLFTAPDAKVLIVDDIAVNLKVAGGLMAHFKMDIDVCLSGEEAIELVQKNKYDIVFMDHMMPGMDGIEATGMIRALGEEYESLPIIALTANAISGMREMFIANGLSGFLAKPIEISKLNSILATWLPKEKLKKGVFEKHSGEIIGMKIDGINMAAGIRYAGESESNYIEILGYFCIDADAKLSEIPDSQRRGDIKLYTTYVHSMKSALANIGAEKLSETAKLLEAAGNNKDITYINDHTDDFLVELKNMTDEITSFLQSRLREKANSAAAGTPGSDTPDKDLPAQDDAILPKSGVSPAQNERIPSDTLEKLELLKDALLKIDIDTIDQLVDSLSDGPAGVIMSEVSQYILIFDYEKAIDLIDRFTFS